MASAFTVRLDDETVSALDRLATATERSRSWLVAKAVEEYVSLNEWQIARIVEGVEAADRGEFASDAEVARVRGKYARRK